uniref:Arrestin C-terminal-like domain-containing protein n=1 Tax=Electrophorus electricus TaxID=8005 RepID=A0A4W4EQT8_ELEEL
LTSLIITHDPVKESNTFANDDNISGRITLEVSKETRVESFFIKAKGKASVLWSERYNSKIVTPGIHVYPFTFQHPHEVMPASFTGYHGKVVYFLEAKLCRSMHIPSKHELFHVTFLTLLTQIPQYGNREKKKKFFDSRCITMNICTEKMGYCLGKTHRIDVENNSSRTVKPKFCLYQKQSFFAMKRRKVRNKILLKEEGDPIGPSTKQSMTKVLNIPKDISVSILSCKVLKVEYRLKVSLDVKFASDPEIKLPVVLFSPPSLTQKADGIAPTSMHVGFESWTSSPAAWNSAACFGSAASDTVDGIYPSMYEWSEKPGGSFPVTHSNLQTTL